MSMKKDNDSYVGNFTEAWERIRSETEVRNFKELGKVIGITQPGISGRKKTGNFPIEWAYLIGKKYNLSTEWVLTGKGSKRKIEPPKEKTYIDILGVWLDEYALPDARNRAIFEVKLESTFPEFKEWLDKRNNTEC
ncbi:MAG: hypothetical protein D3903_07140 [Candidatus Electrothrix sp. GM3_4]|nr:hypothetical protein [Candidatus Electrothrix sp. GM3_4]